MFYLIFFWCYLYYQRVIISRSVITGQMGSEEEIKTELNVAACINPSSPISALQVCPHQEIRYHSY